MVTIYTVEDLEMFRTNMRGNFIRFVNKKSGDTTILYLNGKGEKIFLDYDVQAAVLDLHTDRDSQMKAVVTLKAAVRGLEERVTDLQRPPGTHFIPISPPFIPEPQRDDSISRWVVNTRVISEAIGAVKKIWA